MDSLNRHKGNKYSSGKRGEKNVGIFERNVIYLLSNS